MDRSQKWWQLSSIQLIGGIISIPFITTGLKAGLFDIVIANILIFFFSICVVQFAFDKRQNAIENIKKILGKFGMAVLAILILITIISWMAIHLIEGDRNLQHFTLFPDSYNLVLLAGGAASLLMLFGIRALKIIGIFGAPILMGLLFILLFAASPTTNLAECTTSNAFSIAGLLPIIAISLTAVIDLPTFFRYGKSKRDSIIALIVILIASVFLQSICVFFRCNFVNNEYLDMITGSQFYSFIYIAFITISMIASAAWNIYAASVGLKFIFPEKASNAYCAIVGFVATILFGATNIESFLFTIVTLGEIPISTAIAMITVEFIRKRYASGEISKQILCKSAIWIFSSTVGFIAYYFNHSEPFVVGVSITSGLIFSILGLLLPMAAEDMLREKLLKLRKAIR